MNEWQYLQPVTIVFGDGKLSELTDLCKKLNGSKGILITSPSFVKKGLAQKVVDMTNGLITTIFSELSPNPDVVEVDNCAKIIRDNNIDFVIAMGGGSTLDLAKAAATICKTNDSITKYHGTGVAITEEHLPLIAIPTTSGTGSEVTSVSVLTDHTNGKKAPIASMGFYPDFAIIDPELTYSMPPYITACTGIDVLSHALESYWSNGNQPICDAVAISSLELVFEYLPKAVANGEDKVAREKMCLASVLAGLAFALPKTTSSHACSYPLTNIYDIPHGEACGITLDFFARINQTDRVKVLARKLGFDSVNSLADAILDLKKKVNLRVDMKDFNLTDEQVKELVSLSHHPNLLNNPVEITDDMLFELYNSLR